ncbi:MAG: exodeoxyribonuclease VII large subunit [Candidatus Methylacidiphilales bacterium]|nr:exodeoxyribonuclease VII large subunit [Candidatus Methylacidiphilales bacterium]
MPDELFETKPGPVSVSELTESVRALLESGIGTVRVQGEISNLRRQPSGHMYFTLKDAQSQIRAVFFRGDARSLRFQPKDGDQVVAGGEITVYVPRGEYQIRVTSLQPVGRGSLQERFEALKLKLREEGLFEEARKRPLPEFPRTVAIVTSASGAAVRDFINVLQRRCPRIRIQVYGVRVQGEGAHREIIDALEAIGRAARADIAVVARGGGSLEDLWEFNEEALARAVAACPVPVISGVGHETDFTICDFVADLRAPTPSAAAELLSRADADWFDDLADLREGMDRALQQRLDDEHTRLDAFRNHYVFREPVRLVHQWSQRMDEHRDRLRTALLTQHRQRSGRLAGLRQTWQVLDPLQKIARWREVLASREHQLRLLSPEATLRRGYTMVLDEKGAIVREAKRARALETLRVRFADGEVGARPFKGPSLDT